MPRGEPKSGRNTPEVVALTPLFVVKEKGCSTRTSEIISQRPAVLGPLDSSYAEWCVSGVRVVHGPHAP